MSTEKLRQIVERMEPEAAASAIALILKELFALMDEEARVQVIVNLIGDSGDDNVASLVHL